MTVTTDEPEPTMSEHASVPDRFVRLAEQRAAEGDVRRAQLASWAADVHVLEELLWQNGLAEADDPVAQLAAVGESVASALEALAEQATGEVTAREVVEAARRAMVSTFDESVHEILMAQLPGLDHLDSCDPLTADRADEPADAARLEGRSPERLVEELREAAADCLAVARVMHREGEEETGDRLLHQADLAAFEAYLVAAAVHAGDHQLATVDLRWSLAGHLDPTSWEPSSGDHTFATLRRELISIVGSAEMEALWFALESAEGP